MKSILLFCLFALIACIYVSRVDSRAAEPAAIQQAWLDYQAQYGKEYATDEDKEKRREIFKNKYIEITEHNEKFENGEESYTKGINLYSDLTDTEFQDQILKTQESSINNDDLAILKKDEETNNDEHKLGIPSDYDARSFLGPVKNQLSCGSCWAFSTASVLEAAYRRRTGIQASLSEQYLVDCDQLDYHCSGGWPAKTLSWVMTFGIPHQSNYAYTGQYSGYCTKNTNSVNYRNFTGYQGTNLNDYSLQYYTYYYKSLGAVIDGLAIRDYTGGVFTNTNCKTISHAVNIVGYSTTASTPYWLVRNSWGSSWGESGYLRVRMDANPCLLRNYTWLADYTKVYPL